MPPPSLKANLPVTLNRSLTHVVGVLIGDTVPLTNVPVIAPDLSLDGTVVVHEEVQRNIEHW